MSNSYILGCPECNMSHGMHSPLSMKDEGELQCSANPAHRYTRGQDGFLKSL